MIQLFDQTIDALFEYSRGKPDLTISPFPAKIPIKPCRHFTLFPPRIPQYWLAKDGYDTEWSPPEPFVYRMWTGGKLEFIGDISYGSIEQETSLKQYNETKTSRGPAVFTTLEKTLTQNGSIKLVDTRTLAYMSQKPISRKPIHRNLIPDRVLTVRPNEITLFRFSALTWNSHRIHYDKEWAKSEGYPSLLVHGPLTCTLLLEMYLKSFSTLSSFSYQAISPLFCGEEIHLCLKDGGSSVELWALNSEKGLAMKGTAIK